MLYFMLMLLYLEHTDSVTSEAYAAFSVPMLPQHMSHSDACSLENQFQHHTVLQC